MVTLLRTKTETQEIQELFVRMGGFSPARDVARQAIDEGIFDDEQLEHAKETWAVGRVTEALKASDDYGLPFAGPISKSRAPIWKQRALWDLEDYEFVIAERVADIRASYTVAVRLCDDCEERYGIRPVIPTLE